MLKNILEKLFGNSTNTRPKINKPTINFKDCGKCGRNLESAAFSRHTMRADGLQCWCKDCMSKSKAAKKRKSFTRMRRIREGQKSIKLSFDVTPEQRVVLDEICRSKKTTISKMITAVVQIMVEEHRSKKIRLIHYFRGKYE